MLLVKIAVRVLLSQSQISAPRDGKWVLLQSNTPADEIIKNGGQAGE